MSTTKQCNRCNVKLHIDQFDKKRDGTRTKLCLHCRKEMRKYADKYKCKHGVSKYTCVKCRGSCVCRHKKQRYQCKKCDDGTIFCKHNRKEKSCKTCSDDPIRLTIQLWLHNLKHGDIRKNRYDKKNFVTEPFLELLVEEFITCYHCACDMQYVEYDETLATVERLNNSIGHTMKNCVICCLGCNLKKL